MSLAIKDPDALYVIDDFLADPDAARLAALALDYPLAREDAYFAGRNSSERLALPDLDARLSDLAGTTLIPAAKTVHGHCRISMAGEMGRGGVHVDQSHWSGVLYLSEPASTDPETEINGTDFYRHRASGMTRAPLSPAELARYGVASFPQMWTEVITPQTNDMDKWEHVRRVEMKFNRLVFFRPWLWHAAGPGFGASLEDGRLIVVIALDELRLTKRSAS